MTARGQAPRAERSRPAPTLSRRLALALATLLAVAPALAQEVSVPVSLQIDLLLKVATYDKNLRARAGERVLVAVLVKPDVADSARVASQALGALSESEEVAGLPVSATILVNTDPAAVARLVEDSRVSLLYVTPGFGDAELERLASALDGLSVLSAGALAKYTTRGTVLGFDLVGGKPKLMVHLARAKRQHVELSSAVLKLMRVIE